MDEWTVWLSQPVSNGFALALLLGIFMLMRQKDRK